MPHDHEDTHDHHHPDTVFAKVRHFFAHEHNHDHQSSADLGAEGIRATKISLFGLGATALLQALLVAVTGSVALLSDTIHNFTDALTAIPLWIAFSLGRRPRNKKYTYGYHRAEDLAGVVIVIAIGVSAAGAAFESLRRLSDPRELDFVGWVIVAGIVGAVGNELVARYRRRVGLKINSAALVADADHARADALTSLAVVAAGIGAWLGWQWVDPIAGLAVAAMILRLLWRSARTTMDRLLDAVDPEIVDTIAATALATDGIDGVSGIRARHHGHRLLITLSVAVDPTTTVAEGHALAHDVEHELLHSFEADTEVVVHVDPDGDPEAHQSVAHHKPAED